MFYILINGTKVCESDATSNIIKASGLFSLSKKL